MRQLKKTFTKLPVVPPRIFCLMCSFNRIISQQTDICHLFTESTGSGSTFGVALAQCVETERALRRQQHGGSRASLASFGATEKGDDVSRTYRANNR